MKHLKICLRPFMWLSALCMAALVVGCGGGGSGDQGRDPILGIPAATLVSLTVSPASSTIAIGNMQQFMATATYSDGASFDVTATSTWTSTTIAVAEINSKTGVAEAIAKGSSLITANYSNKTGTATLIVSPATLVAIDVLPDNPTIIVGEDEQFIAMGTYSDGTTSDISAISTFTTASPAVASIIPTGLALGVSAGTSVISATSGALVGKTTLTVTPAILVSIAISPLNPTLQIAATQQFSLIATYSDDTSKDVTKSATFTSATPAVASFGATKGKATAVAAGTSLITGSFLGKNAATTLTVKAASLSSITVTPATATINVSGTQQFIATGTYSDGTSADITDSASWTSGTTAIATVLSTGVATGVSGGTSAIIAAFDGKSASGMLTVTQPTSLTSITVSPSSATVLKGSTQAFVATANYSDGTSANITNIVVWKSGTTAIATVLSTGVATGISGGTSAIIATFGGKSASGMLTVSTPTSLSAITVSPSTASIVQGSTQAFVATATYSDGTNVNVTKSVVWTSSSTVVATVLSSGMASGLSAGSSTIKATLGSKSGSGLLTVTQGVIISSIAVTPANATIAIGATQAFVATATYSNGSIAILSNNVTWTSNATAIATVGSNGVATGLSGGIANITASSGGKSGSAVLTVQAPSTLVSIAITPLSPSAPVGATQQFSATANYSNGTSNDVTNSVIWSSSVTSVATIMPSGLATAVAAGVTNISATQGSLSATTTFTVTAAVVGINLGGATNFGVLAGNSITNNSGGLTLVTGDVGSPSQTVDPVQVAGFTNYKSGAILATALADLQVAIADANSRICDVNSASGIDLGGQTLSPGVYCYAGAINITGTFTMNGPGLYIFRTSSTLNSVANSVVALNAGASAGSVFWVPVAATTLGANSVFKGTIMAQSAAITMGDMATLQNGRVLSASAVTLKNNVISR